MSFLGEDFSFLLRFFKYQMRLLVISTGRWTAGGCFGSTYSSIFGEIPDIEVAHIYCGTGLPESDIPANITRFFQINEKRLIRSLFRPASAAGAEVFRKEVSADQVIGTAEFTSRERQCVDFLRRHHWAWLKYLNYYTIWKVGHWKSPALRDFVASFKPDAIWAAVSPNSPALRMALYLKKLTGLPMTGYIYDEHYSLKKFRCSPAYWLFHLVTRRLIRKVVQEFPFFYVISDAQKEYYERKFHIPCRVITRTFDFNHQPKFKPHESGTPWRLVYTGNLSNKRYEALMRVGKAIRISGLDARLDVYSAQPVSRRLCRRLESSGKVRFCGKVPASEIGKILSESDILVHAEGFSTAYRISARMAFSTKIVEYLHSGKPILAVGPHEMNSIDYFDRHRSGLTAETVPQITEALRQLTNPDAAEEYADRAWKTGAEYHQTAPAQTRLSEELKGLITELE